MSNNFKTINFKKELEEIKSRKIANGTWKPNKILSDRRIMKALRKMEDWSTIKERLILAEMREDFNENE